MGKDAKALFRKGVLCLWVVFGVTGFPGLMIAAKKGVPGPIVEKLANVFDQARISPGFQKYAKENYIFQDGMPLVGQKLQDYLTKAYKDIGEMIQKLGIEKK